MKFIKGMVVGTLVSAGIAMMCTETMMTGKGKMIRKGKQFAKKLGLM